MEYNIAKIKIENENNMHIIVKYDITINTVIIEGYYKIKGNTKLVRTKLIKIDSINDESFQDILVKLYKDVIEAVNGYEIIKELFKNITIIKINLDG